MEEARPTVQEAYLREAQTMGRDYYQKVKIGGKNYFVMVLQGGDLSRMQMHDTEKLTNLAESFFSAHQEASETDLNESDITHIDSTGIHFSDRETQVSSDTGIDEATQDLLMEEFDSEKDAIVQHHDQARPAPVAKEAVPAQYRPYLNEAHEDEDGLYDEDAVNSAIESYAFSRLNRIKDLVISANPANREEIDRRFREIENSNDYLEDSLDEACAMLKQHMTAQTVWKAMMNVLLPEQLLFVAAPEEEEEFFDFEEEAIPLKSGPFGHLDSLDSLPLGRSEDRRVEDREFEVFDPVFQEPLLYSEQGSVHEHEEIRVAPVTAQQVYTELNLAAQGAPEGNVPVSSKQAVARTALEKIRSKMRKEEDIEAFTADEQRIIKKAITRNARFMQGRSHNSQLSTILGGLETISRGH